jgi:CheY-like chemotaxis protein
MPLQSLISRRVYLIQNASDNRYVPALLDDAKAMRTVACLPLYAGPRPVGSIVIIAAAPSVFAEHHIKTLEQPQRELVGMIEALRRQAAKARRREAGPDPVPYPTEPAATAAAAPAAAPPPAADPGAQQTAPQDTPELGGASKSAPEAQILRAQLAVAKAAATAREREFVTAAQRKHDELNDELERLRTQLADAESTTTTREQELLATSQHEHNELTAELERLRTQLAGAAAAAAAREEELLAQLRQKEGDLSGELAATAARERRAREELAAALEAERARVAALETEVTTRQRDQAAEVERLAARLTASEARRPHEAARIDELEQARAELAEKLEAAATREGTLRPEIDTLKRLADERAAELTAARERACTAEHAAGETEAEAAAMRNELAEARARIDELSGTSAEIEEKIAQLTARADEAENRRAQLEHELEAAQARTRETEARLTTGRDETPSMAEEGSPPTPGQAGEVDAAAAEQPVGLKVAHVTPEDTTPSVAPAVAAPTDIDVATTPADQPAASGPSRFVIIDSEECWGGVALDEQQVIVVTPGADLDRRVGHIHREPILVNLAVPGALAAIASLRAGGLTTRFSAYIARPGTGQALRLGMIETTPSPMDPEVVLAALEGQVARGTRLLTAGADADAFMSLRQALSRHGVSVSMAWDSTQAVDLLATVRPDMAVIDLDLPPRGGYGVLAGLAQLNPVPSVILISKGTENATRFAMEATDRSRAALLVTLHQVITVLLKSKDTPESSRR